MAPFHFGWAFPMCTGVETVKQSLNSFETYQVLFHSLNAHRHNEKKSFRIRNEGEVQGQSSPELTGILTVLKCICCPNLEILTRIGGELWFGQAQNGVNFEFGVKFDLEGQGQLPPKTIGNLTKVFCFSGPNLVILAWTGDELSSGQASDWYTHKHRHRQRQYPEAKTVLG